jgi:SAM-dependent methyltransferase
MSITDKEMHIANQRYWDATASRWQELRDRDNLWQKCPHQPELAFQGGSLEMICAFMGDLHGKRVCVIASGDNYAAFGLAGMGARVTSTDISQAQLQIATQRAEILGLEIEFLRADAADLALIADDGFDLVCSTNGLFVWIASPRRVFDQVYRILKPGGYYIFYDIHPFLRPWKDQLAPLEMEKPYTETGPFISEEPSGPVYEFNWRISDVLNPLLESGLVLRRLAESPPTDSRFWQDSSYLPGNDERLLDWKVNPRAGLPVWLSITSQKPLTDI